MEYVFGPIPSRRLGRSLGIDPVPFKTCNWNCVYCQLGRSTPLTNERREYVPVSEVLDQLAARLEALGPGSFDWVTFSGSGEPTLHSGLGRILQGVKALTPAPVAVITNGALLDLPEVRADLALADAVLPSLDAGSEAVYRRVNRPWPGLSFDRLIEGLCAFRREYAGKLWVEVMLVTGVNDTPEALAEIARALRRVGADEVHVNQPVRPPAEGWVAAPDPAAMERARATLGQAARVVQAGGAARQCVPRGSVEDAVLGMVTRHPMDLDQLLQALDHWSPGELGQALAELSGSGRIRAVSHGGRQFWTSAEARYGGVTAPVRR